jgi:hypothetical protein
MLKVQNNQELDDVDKENEPPGDGTSTNDAPAARKSRVGRAVERAKQFCGDRK